MTPSSQSSVTSPLTPSWLSAARDSWSNRGQQRPDFAVTPGPGQESVWDYPRPPAVVTDDRQVEVRIGDVVVASTSRAVRVLETSHPPSFYLPPGSINESVLVPVPGRSHCEWKGEAEYLGLAVDGAPIGWRYTAPYPDFALWAGYVSFYPAAVDCWVGDEQVRPQAGGFYGGWITDEIVGPFKGENGSAGW